MAHQYEIIPEDGAIRVLVQILGYPNPHNLGGGSSVVLPTIEKQFKNRFAIGLIDDDKRKPKAFDQYQTLIKEENNLQLRHKFQSQHFLIVLYPAVEDWLLENVRLTKIDFKNFKTRQDLMRVTKNKDVAKDQTFKRFLNDLKQADAPGLVTMAAWIKELRERHVW